MIFIINSLELNGYIVKCEVSGDYQSIFSIAIISCFKVEFNFDNLSQS